MKQQRILSLLIIALNIVGIACLVYFAIPYLKLMGVEPLSVLTGGFSPVLR